MSIGEFFFDFEDVGHFRCLFEELAKAISEGDLILDFGLKIAGLPGDVVLADTFTGHFCETTQLLHVRL